MKENEIKKEMNAIYGKHYSKRSMNSSHILKRYNYTVRIRRNEMTKEEIEEMIKRLHHDCYLEHQYVLRYTFKKINNVNELKSKQDIKYHKLMDNRHIKLYISHTKQCESDKIIMNMISKYGDKFLRTIISDSNNKAVDICDVMMSIPCSSFVNTSIWDILKESAIDDDKFNECIDLLPETLTLEFKYSSHIPLLEDYQR